LACLISYSPQTGPLMQAWYSRAAETRFPYRLFALSNLGSLLALLAYPLGIEPLLALRRQPNGVVDWLPGSSFCSRVGLALRSRLQPLEESFPARSRPLLWIALAACASSLWLAVANHSARGRRDPVSLGAAARHLSTEFHPVLRSGRLVSAKHISIDPASRLDRDGFTTCRTQVDSADSAWQFALLSAALLICCLFCHGELARLKTRAS